MGLAHAQEAPASDAVPAPAATPAAFVLEVRATDDIRDYLERHLELQRYRDLVDLDDNELARLTVAAGQNTRELLGTLGYFSPQIDLALQPAAPGTARTVVITVDPGVTTRVSLVDLQFVGAIGTDEAATEQRRLIRADWALRRGMPFTQTDWDAAKTAALRELTRQRYPTGTITASHAEIDTDTHSAKLSLTLDSGPLYRVGTVQIEGIERYEDTLARRLARIPSGGEYDQSRLLEAQQRLMDSGYFDSALVTLDTSGDPAAAPVKVQVREAKMQKITLGVGASTDAGPRLTVEHRHHKVPGIGWSALTKLSIDRETQSLGTELLSRPEESGWRWLNSALFQKQTSGSFDVYSQRYRLGRTQAGERIDRNVFAEYDRARTAGVGVNDTAESLSTTYAWTQRNFDSIPFPSSGYGLSVELGTGITLRSGGNPYVRNVTRWLGYWSLADSERITRSVLRSGRIAVRLEGGAVVARSEARIPDTQLFLTGGDNTVRGYSLRSIGTRLPTGQTTAGRYLAVGSVEWQRPITVNDRLTEWESTLFVDAGAVADQPGNLKPRVGLGTGVRWRSPVGPLQMDVAYGVTPRQLRLHLSVGFTF
ncbi:MAG: autotransporter assembly complex protein TamA [Burkholderiales bacterium]|nr:autotransporter assembly complex protein TamA [Burkholderiales bacterium]